MDTGQRDGGAPTWKSSTSYPLGQSVVGSNHGIWVVVLAGTSGTLDPVTRGAPGQVVTVADGDLVWMDIGPSSNKPGWQPNRHYSLNEIVSAGNRDYQVIRFTAGLSGSAPSNLAEPDFPILEPKTVIEPRQLIRDGELRWLDSGVVRPMDLPHGGLLSWRANRRYRDGTVIFVPGLGNGRYYTAQVSSQDGRSGDLSPFTFSSTLPITWEDSGVTPPSSVATGQPTDQTVNLINLSLPQTHSLSYFNISAGFIGDFKRTSTFGFVPSNNKTAISGTQIFSTPKAATGLAVDPTTGCTTDPPPFTATSQTYYCPTNLGLGPFGIDPVLVLTVYFPPIDAERRWRPRDLIPALSVAGSLASPTSNFYLGASSEIFRNIQLFYGLAFQKVAKSLGNPSTKPAYGGIGTAPAGYRHPGSATRPVPWRDLQSERFCTEPRFWRRSEGPVVHGFAALLP